MKKLLVCTDGSAYSNVCCEYAAWLAERTGADIEVLYVTDLRQFEVPLVADLSGSLGIQPYQAVLSQLQKLEEQKAEVVLDSARTLLEKRGLGERCTFTHKTGLLVDSLGDMEKSADLVMLGKRGENANFATEHLGSTVERIVRASRKPCFVTSRSLREIKRMLIAYDGGPSCRKALDFISASQAFKDLEVHVVTVAENPGKEEKYSTHLSHAERRLKEAGFNPRCQMLHGAPEEEIAHYVVKEQTDLLVMGAYGHSRIRQFIIGSTTTEMIRACKIPVLLFR